MSSSGWTKMKDPNTGMDYYANRVTRQTQWDKPPGFMEAEEVENTSYNRTNTNASGNTTGNDNDNGNQYNLSTSGFGSFKNSTRSNDAATAAAASGVSPLSLNTGGTAESSIGNDDALPSNWERLFDQASGKHFYIDHVNKVTTWERPKVEEKTKKTAGMATGFGIIPESALDRNINNNNNINSSSSTSKKKIMASTATSATSPTWQYYGSNPPPSTTHSHSTNNAYTAAAAATSKPSSTIIQNNDDISTKYYHENYIDFSVQKVPDRLRVSCPSCNIIFSMPLKRRHHCRVCQDVFCDACSSHRVSLPFDGEEYIKPVRVCDMCHSDIVEHGNFFSMRRYLTPLQLYDGEDIMMTAEGGDAMEFTSQNVRAALSGLARDLESLLLDSTGFTEKVTIPSDVLVKAICRHLKNQDTCHFAIKVLSTLISLGNVVGDMTFLMEVYTIRGENVFDDIMTLLEWSGSGNKTLAVQEQAAQILFYLTDGKLIGNILRQGEEEKGGGSWSDALLSQCDIHRALRSTLDHTTQTMSPSLQRWSAACICNLIAEDYRRSCEAINYTMAMGVNELKYESFIMEMISSGGVMILSSLVSSDDSDTRNYAMKALSATIETSREINIQLSVLREAYGIDESSNYSDTSIIDGIVSAGACNPLTQLLLSADDTVASMGCSFARSLVHPLLTNPLGSALPCYHRFLSVAANVSTSSVGNEDGLGTYRNAALQMASSDGILSALVYLISDNTHSASRPIDLKRSAMEILAAIAMTLSFWDSKVKAMGISIESNQEWESIKFQVDSALVSLEEECLGEAVAMTFSSSSFSSINTSRDSTTSQLKEASSLVICAMSACSPTIAAYFFSCNIVPKLINNAADDGYASKSHRGDWASRRLSMVEAIAMILVQGWQKIQIESYNNDEADDHSPIPLGLLLESLDAGVIPLLSRLLDNRIDNDPDTGYGDVRLKIALCHIIGSIFGIGQCDKTNIGFARIFEALGNDHYVIPLTNALLGSTIIAVQQNNSSSQRQLPLSSLLEANLIAMGSICGSRYCSFSSVGIDGDKDILKLDVIQPEDKDVFSCQFEEVCSSSCETITKNSFIASCLVGAFGEGAIMPIIRLVSAIAENGPQRSHQMLANNGILLPISDMLRDALVTGDYYVFASCLSLISICGPQLNSNSENSAIQSLRGCIRMLTNVLTIDDGDARSSQGNILSSLKRKCVNAIERLSSNAGLWVTIVAHFVPCASAFLARSIGCHSPEDIKTVIAVLRVIKRVISLPDHALKISRTNLGVVISQLICEMNSESSGCEEIEIMSLDILQTLISMSITKQQKQPMLESDGINAACTILSKNDDKCFSTNLVAKTKLALELILTIAVDLESIDDASLSSSSRIIAFVESIGMHNELIRRLCATLTQQGGIVEEHNENKIDSLFGSTILLFEGECGPFHRSLDAAIYLLYRISLYSSIIDTSHGDEFWNIFFLEDQKAANAKTKSLVTTASCATFLNALVDEDGGVCTPINKGNMDSFRLSLPIVRERLLVGLHAGVEEFSAMKNNDDGSSLSFCNMLKTYSIPQSCLGLCKSPFTLDSAYHVLEIILSEFPDVLVESVVTDMISLKAIFDLLSANNHGYEVKTKPEMVRIFAAVTLSAAAKLRILGPAVKRYGLRSLAIASLSTACLMEEQDSVEYLAEDLTGDGSSMSSLCLNAIVNIVSMKNDTVDESYIELSPSEAKAIAASLGKKISNMVLEHFMKRENGEFNVDVGDDVDKLPEVKLLCSLTSIQESLIELCTQGGIEALSLIASDGIEPAIVALRNVCNIDSDLVLNVDGHVSVMQVISYHSEENSHSTKEVCMDFLASISMRSKSAKEAISSADESSACIEFASSCILNHAKMFSNTSSDGVGDLLGTAVETEAVGAQAKIDDTQIVLSSLTLLSALAQIKSSRTKIISDLKLHEALGLILELSSSQPIKHIVSLLLATLGRYVKDFEEEGSQYSVSSLSSILLLGFKAKHTGYHPQTESTTPLFGNFSKVHHYNENLVLATICTAYENMFSNMTTDQVKEVLPEIIVKFADVVTNEMKMTKKIAMKTRNGGLLARTLATFMYLCSLRPEYQNDLKVDIVLTDLFRLVLLNPGEKLVEGKKDNDDEIKALKVDKVNWNCCVMQCLQCLAILSTEPLETTDESRRSKSWDEIITSVESEVQFSLKNKRSTRLLSSTSSKTNQVAQVKAVAVLNKFWSEGFDSGSSVAAKKVLDNLDLHM